VVRDLLTAAMDAGAADFGNIQLFDSTDHSLRIVAQHGFQNEFLDYFARVRDSDCACGVAMARRSRVTVPDTASDPVFQGRARSVVLSRRTLPAVTTATRGLWTVSRSLVHALPPLWAAFTTRIAAY
jgi:GAF domain-containing protein